MLLTPWRVGHGGEDDGMVLIQVILLFLRALSEPIGSEERRDFPIGLSPSVASRRLTKSLSLLHMYPLTFRFPRKPYFLLTQGDFKCQSMSCLRDVSVHLLLLSAILFLPYLVESM